MTHLRDVVLQLSVLLAPHGLAGLARSTLSAAARKTLTQLRSVSDDDFPQIVDIWNETRREALEQTCHLEFGDLVHVLGSGCGLFGSGCRYYEDLAVFQDVRSTRKSARDFLRLMPFVPVPETDAQPVDSHVPEGLKLAHFADFLFILLPYGMQEIKGMSPTAAQLLAQIKAQDNRMGETVRQELCVQLYGEALQLRADPEWLRVVETWRNAVGGVLPADPIADVATLTRELRTQFQRLTALVPSKQAKKKRRKRVSANGSLEPVFIEALRLLEKKAKKAGGHRKMGKFPGSQWSFGTLVRWMKGESRPAPDQHDAFVDMLCVNGVIRPTGDGEYELVNRQVMEDVPQEYRDKLVQLRQCYGSYDRLAKVMEDTNGPGVSVDTVRRWAAGKGSRTGGDPEKCACLPHLTWWVDLTLQRIQVMSEDPQPQ